MEKYYYSYEEFLKDIKELNKKIDKFNPDTLLAIARGGLTISHFLGILRENRRVFSLNSIHYDKEKKLNTIDISNIPDLSSAQKVLLIDDISDSGETLNAVKEIIKNRYPNINLQVATIFYKESSIVKPEYYLHPTKAWIDFFWEIDLF